MNRDAAFTRKTQPGIRTSFVAQAANGQRNFGVPVACFQSAFDSLACPSMKMSTGRRYNGYPGPGIAVLFGQCTLTVLTHELGFFPGEPPRSLY